MNTSLSLNLPFNYIQSIRLAHAIMETNYDIYIPREDENKFIPLKQKFGIKYKIITIPDSVPSEIKISHKEPKTSIGSINRSLIFPHQIFSYCKSLWSDNRNIQFSFAGLITENRKQFFRRFVKINYPDSKFNFKKLALLELQSKFKSKIEHKIGVHNIPKAIKFKYNKILFWSSERGRNFPVKVWDDDYFRLLASSKFVLCPSGDYTWSYRFFEACRCGAIPIIEDFCSIYDGYRFKTINEPLNTIIWSKKDAEHNYNLCQSRLTVPLDRLQEEIAELLYL